jgi:hypothetical protein
MIKLSSIFTHKHKLSKYETALLKAFRVNDIEDVAAGAVVALKRIPDVVVIADGDNSGTSITLASGAASTLEADRIVKVVNKDAAEAVTVLGVSCPASSTTELRFNGSSFAEL